MPGFDWYGPSPVIEWLKEKKMYCAKHRYRGLSECKECRIEDLEIQLAEAQQWIDSEPGWKDHYMKRYMALQDETKRLQSVVDAVNEVSDKGVVTPGFWERVAARQTVKVSELEERVRRLKAKLRKNCLHFNTHRESWPDGGGIEVCDDCGMSRHHWEQGQTDWIVIEDIEKARKEVQEGLCRVRNG